MSLLSQTLASTRILKDQIISLLALVIGALLPTLQTPQTDLTNKTAIVTGANSGIGFSLALSLAKQNATVYLACRSTAKAREAAAQIIDAAGVSSNRVRVVSLDTSSLASVRAFAESWTGPIDLLYHNAGIAGAEQKVTSEGLGTIYATNFAGSFLLTSLLEKHLSPTARVILTSSTGQYAGDARRVFTLPRLVPQGQSDSALYSDTKFQQVVFASLLQKRFDAQSKNVGKSNGESESTGTGSRTAHAFTPGYTYTPIFDKIPGLPWYVDPLYWVLKAATALCVPVEQGAATGFWLGTAGEKEVGGGGEYWDRCVRRATKAGVLGGGEGERMWQLWEVDSGAVWA